MLLWNSFKKEEIPVVSSTITTTHSDSLLSSFASEIFTQIQNWMKIQVLSSHSVYEFNITKCDSSEIF